MKKLALIFVSAILIMGCGSGEETDHDGDEENGGAEAVVQVAANETIQLGIEGMVCSVGCAKAIEEKIGGMSGIASCVVAFENGQAEISFDNKTVSSKEIISTIAEMNDGQYKVNDLQKADQKSDEPAEEEDNDDVADASGFVPSFTVPQVATYLVNIF